MVSQVFPTLCQCLRCNISWTVVVPLLFIVAVVLLLIALNCHNFYVGHIEL